MTKHVDRMGVAGVSAIKMSKGVRVTLGRVLLVVGLAAIPTVQASIMVYTSFEGYTQGAELADGAATQLGDVGLPESWTESNVNSGWTVVERSLSYTVDGGQTISGGSKAVQQTGTDNTKHFSSAILDNPITETFYARFLVLFDAAVSGGAVAQLAFEQTGTESKFHTGGGLGMAAGANNDAFLAPLTTTSSITRGGPEVILGETMLVILRANWDADNSRYGSYNLWVNPGAMDEASPDLTVAATLTLGSVDRLILHGGVTGTSDPRVGLYMDEIQYSTTWTEAIAPVPEPGTLTLAGLGLSALFLRRRTRD